MSLSVPSLACSFTFLLHKFEQGFFPGSGSLQVGLYISFCLSVCISLSVPSRLFTSSRRGSSRVLDLFRLVCTSLSVCLSFCLYLSLCPPLSLVHSPFRCTSSRRGSSQDQDHFRLVSLSVYLSVCLSCCPCSRLFTYLHNFEEGFFPGSGSLQVGL